MKITVRPASENDADILAGLSRIVLAWHAEHYPADFRADVETPELAAFFSKQIADENACLAIAEMDGEPIGYVFVRHKPRNGSAFTPPRPPRVYIEHLAVTADRRRQGAGSALMAYVEAQREDGAEIALSTMALNAAAQAFFTRQGFEAARLEMRRRP